MDTLRDFLYRYKKFIIVAIITLASAYAINEILWYSTVLGVIDLNMMFSYFIMDIVLDLLILLFAAIGLIICVNSFAKEKA